MRKALSFSDIVHRTLSGERKNIEPVPRMCGGYGPRFVRHRFDIKGGISAVDVLADNVMRNNVLWMRISQEGVEVIDANTVYRDA